MKKLFLVVALLMIPVLAFAGPLRELKLNKDGNRETTYGIQLSWVGALVLAANTAETYTVQNGTAQVLFSCTEDFWVIPGGNATVPSADVTNGAASFLNPAMVEVGSKSSFGIISESACKCSIAEWGRAK